MTSRLAEHPGVLYDISCFFPLDVIELLARAPIERIVFASDPPYGLPATSLYMALRVAAQAGLDEARTRAGMLGGTMAGAARRPRAAAGDAPRRGSSITLSGRLARVYGYASLVGPALFTGVGRAGPGDARHGDRRLPRPRSGRRRRGARDDRRALERRRRRCCARCGRDPPGDRLVYRSIVRGRHRDARPSA